jgi:hypothetical protein
MTDRYNSTASGQAPVNELENTAGHHGCWSPPSGGAVREIPGEVLTHPDDHGYMGESRLQSEHDGIRMWTEEQHCVTPAECPVPEPR